MMPSREQLAEWVGRLVRIPSVNPAQAGPRAGEAGEGRIAAQVAAWFADLGAEVCREEVLPGRPSVYGVWRRGAGGNEAGERWVALDVHVDTVGVEQMTGDPFDGRVANGRVWGRGAVDTKASLGVALAVLEALRASGRRPAPNLLVAATVDEESGGNGARAFADWARRQEFALDQLMVAEPTGCAPVYAHKGAVRLQFTVAGRAAHSSQPHLGQNAISGAALVVLALAAEAERLRAAPAATALGPPALTVTRIEGGRGMNVVPDACVVWADRRMVPGEDGEAVTAALRALAESAGSLPVTTRLLRQFDPFSQDPASPWLRRLAGWSGQAPATVPYGTNAWAYGGLARETVVLGPGSIDQAHGEEEWVEVAELEKLADLYARWWGVTAA
jgi:acetylornithine deacetylase/succinyl-diaminopimelate desuccinylase-like protein